MTLDSTTPLRFKSCAQFGEPKQKPMSSSSMNLSASTIRFVGSTGQRMTMGMRNGRKFRDSSRTKSAMSSHASGDVAKLSSKMNGLSVAANRNRCTRSSSVSRSPSSRPRAAARRLAAGEMVEGCLLGNLMGELMLATSPEGSCAPSAGELPAEVGVTGLAAKSAFLAARPARPSGSGPAPRVAASRGSERPCWRAAIGEPRPALPLPPLLSVIWALGMVLRLRRREARTAATVAAACCASREATLCRRK
mmetsp:Transcript_39197/g.113265  ORF Transcript_39197/g.113265 Transcript_39197/m.113265 type:complete len:250 (-) Transcript_39197:1229-1978(-)